MDLSMGGYGAYVRAVIEACQADPDTGAAAAAA